MDRRNFLKKALMGGAAVIAAPLIGSESKKKSKVKEIRKIEGFPVLRLPSKYLSNKATPEEKKLASMLIKRFKSIQSGKEHTIPLPVNVSITYRSSDAR